MANLYTKAAAERIRRMGGASIPDNTPTSFHYWSRQLGYHFPGWEGLYHSLSSTDWVSFLGAIAMVTPGYSSPLRTVGNLRKSDATLEGCTALGIRYQRLHFLKQALT